MVSSSDNPRPASNSLKTCPKCGAQQTPAADTCLLCFSPLTPQAVAAVGQEPPVILTPTPPPASGFSLASLMLFITLACVLLGMATQWPGLGIPLAVISL